MDKETYHFIDELGRELRGGYKIKEHFCGFPQLYPEYFLISRRTLINPLGRVVCGACTTSKEFHIGVDERTNPIIASHIMQRAKVYAQETGKRLVSKLIKRSPLTIHTMSELDRLCPEA